MRSRLEEYLRDGGATGGFQDLEAHLAACNECRDEVNVMQMQSVVLRSLRAPKPIEPGPDFYAKVLQRIEQTRPSVWTLFADSLFARRLAWSAAAALFLLTSYLATPENPAVQSPRVVAEETSSSPEVVLAGRGPEAPPAPIEVHPSGRSAVLVSLASYNQDYQ